MNIDDITYEIIGAAIQVHSVLGPGLLESAYGRCLAYEMEKRGLVVRKEFLIPLKYEEIAIGDAYRVDFLVNDTVILELKSVEKILGIHKAQTITYLTLASKPAGLLINFNVELLKDGIHRLFPRSSS
ncbi:GxxExxY protein [soil metagenome]